MVHPYLIDVETTIEQYMKDTRASLAAFVAQTAESPEVVVVEAGLFNNLIERVFMYDVARSRGLRRRPGHAFAVTWSRR